MAPRPSRTARPSARGLVFGESAAIWFRHLPATDTTRDYQRRRDGRRFLPPVYLRAGFDSDRDLHDTVGAGLRFCLRTVAVPLVGIDAGYGIGQGPIRFVLVVGV
jgi:hypothetical protein